MDTGTAASQPQLTADGLEQGLTTRHIRMIAIGGAIGTGLFLGAGKGISQAGPGLVGVYAVTGVFIFIVMRALGELLIHKPVTGSFAEYAKDFLGPVYGYITAWGYWITWTIIGMAEITAAGIYVQYWFPGIPQYVTAFTVLAALVLLNLIRVGAFGEAEFWFASIKIAAIVLLIIGGVLAMVFGIGHAGDHGTPANLFGHGGVVPHGWTAVLMSFQIVIFSYQGVELIGMTASEAKDRDRVLPKAINSIPWRIGLFYVGALTVLLSLLPWDRFSASRSPFVQAFSAIGLPVAGGVMNFVVLTSALSACSSGLFSNGRLLKKLATDGLAPARLARTSSSHVPASAIVTSGLVMLVGVLVNAVVPDKAFAYISSVATLGAIWSWGIIICCHLAYRRRVARGQAQRSWFRLPLATPLCCAALVFLTGVTALLAFDPEQRIALYALPVWAVLLLAGYALSRRRQRPAHMPESSQPGDPVQERA
ncbi:amino acid permease [Streptomyces mexicanus]|jgi:AAT family amino acid transporter/D-serine/D-alanine/glycine transporter|uniref:amino acid permease n=1 Tax=Streptomyces mexicanus TaxID=178566 RepID=UPI00368C1C17